MHIEFPLNAKQNDLDEKFNRLAKQDKIEFLSEFSKVIWGNEPNDKFFVTDPRTNFMLFCHASRCVELIGKIIAEDQFLQVSFTKKVMETFDNPKFKLFDCLGELEAKMVAHIEKLNPPERWNGKLVFLGVSEGGLLVTSLTIQYTDITVATINWCGAGDWSWDEELWAFINNMSFSFKIPVTKDEYQDIMKQMLIQSCTDKEFMGMTYKYHADALAYPLPEYSKIETPFLVVAGCLDSFINSSDAFVEKGIAAGAPINYLRISDMDHYILKRSDVIQKSFNWLKEQITQRAKLFLIKTQIFQSINNSCIVYRILIRR